MKLTSRKKGRSKIELQMTSMIDVVFQLLIFFMVSASFVKTEKNLDPAIKVKKSSITAATSHLEPAIVEVSRGTSGFVFKLGGRETESQEELTSILRQFENKVDGAFVKVADDAPFAMAAAAIQACKSAGFLAVSYVPSEDAKE
jgi:biopolymer transport protein ExbD